MESRFSRLAVIGVVLGLGLAYIAGLALSIGSHEYAETPMFPFVMSFIVLAFIGLAIVASSSPGGGSR